MMAFRKFVFFLAVSLCLVQLSAGRLGLDRLLYENIKFDLYRNTVRAGRDLEREIANTRHKLIKDAGKMSQKVLKPEAVDCIESARLQADTELNEKSHDILGCVQELQESLETELKPESGLRELFMFRSMFRNQLNACRNQKRIEIRAVRDQFFIAARQCLI